MLQMEAVNAIRKAFPTAIVEITKNFYKSHFSIPSKRFFHLCPIEINGFCSKFTDFFSYELSKEKDKERATTPYNKGVSE